MKYNSSYFWATVVRDMQKNDGRSIEVAEAKGRSRSKQKAIQKQEEVQEEEVEEL